MNPDNEKPGASSQEGSLPEDDNKNEKGQTVVHPFDSDKEITQEEIDKEQQYKEALTERD